MNLLGDELVEDRYGNGTVGHCRKKSNSPMAHVPATDGYLVARLDIAVLKKDVHLLYLASHVLILESGALIVGKSIKVPMLDDAFLYIRIETWYLLRNIQLSIK